MSLEQESTLAERNEMRARIQTEYDLAGRPHPEASWLFRQLVEARLEIKKLREVQEKVHKIAADYLERDSQDNARKGMARAAAAGK